VDAQEAAGAIEPLPEDDTPTSILQADPEPGEIVDRKEYPVLGATELTLSNGMRVSALLHHPNPADYNVSSKMYSAHTDCNTSLTVTTNIIASVLFLNHDALCSIHASI